MNGTNSRRGFLKGFGLFSAVLAGGTAHSVSEASTGGIVRDSSDAVRSAVVDESLAPVSKTLSLMTNNAVKDITVVSAGSGYVAGPATPTEPNKAILSVGRDNRLWIEVNGQWRRVALEG